MTSSSASRVVRPEVDRALRASEVVRGDGTIATRHKFKLLRERLLTEDDGARAVVAALAHLKRKHPRLTNVAKVLAYFRRNKGRMHCAQWKREGVHRASP